MFVRQIHDEKLAQYAYLVGCPATGEAAVIDPERDVDRYIALAERHRLRLVAAIDTHIHADYLSGLRELAERGVTVYASDEVESFPFDQSRERYSMYALKAYALPAMYWHGMLRGRL